MEVGLFNVDTKGTPISHQKPFIKASFVLPGGVPDTEAFDYRAVFNTEHQVYYMRAIQRQPIHSTFNMSEMKFMGHRRPTRTIPKIIAISHEEQSVALVPAAAQSTQYIGVTQIATQAGEGSHQQSSQGTEPLASPIPFDARPTQHIEELRVTTQVVEGPHQPLTQDSSQQTATLLTAADSLSAIQDDRFNWADEAEENGTYASMLKQLTQLHTSSSNLPSKSNDDTEATGIVDACTPDVSTSNSNSDSYSGTRSTSSATTPEPPASPESEKASVLSEDGTDTISKLIDASPFICNECYSTPLDTIICGSLSSWLETREHHRDTVNEQVASLDYRVDVPGDLSGYMDRLTSRWKVAIAPKTDSLLSSLEMRGCNDGTLQNYKFGQFNQHHLNYYNIPIYHKSSTPPEVSLWMAHQNYNKEQYNRLTRQKVLASQAGKYIDRVRYSGPADILTLRGTALRDAVTGYVDISYLPVGRWQWDLYASDESIPVYSDPNNTYRHQVFDREGKEIVTFGPVGSYVMRASDGDLVVNDDGRTPPVALSWYRVATKERSPLRVVTSIDDDDDVEGDRVQMLSQGRIDKFEDLMPTRHSSPKVFSFDRIYQGATIVPGSTTVIEESMEDIDADDAYFYDDPDLTTESQHEENVDSENDYNVVDEDNMNASSDVSNENEDDQPEGADKALSKRPTHYILSQDVSHTSEDVNELSTSHDASVMALFHTKTSTGDMQLPLAYVEGKIHEAKAEAAAEGSINDEHRTRGDSVKNGAMDEDVVHECAGDEQKEEQNLVEGDALKHLQAQERSKEEEGSTNTEANLDAGIEEDEDMDALSDASTEHGEDALLAEADSALFRGPTHYILSRDVRDTLDQVDEPLESSGVLITLLHQKDLYPDGLHLPFENVEGEDGETDTRAEDAVNADSIKDDRAEDEMADEDVVEVLAMDKDIVEERAVDDNKEKQHVVDGDALKHIQAQEVSCEEQSSKVIDTSSSTDVENSHEVLDIHGVDPTLLPSEDAVIVQHHKDILPQLDPTKIPLPNVDDEQGPEYNDTHESQDTVNVQKSPKAIKMKTVESRIGLGKNHWQDQPLHCLLHRINAVTTTANTLADECDTLPLLSSFVSHNLPFVEYSDVSEIPPRPSSNDSIIKKSMVSVGRMARRLVTKCAGKGWRW